MDGASAASPATEGSGRGAARRPRSQLSFEWLGVRQSTLLAYGANAAAGGREVVEQVVGGIGITWRDARFGSSGVLV